MSSADALEGLARELADLRHDRFGFYGPALRDQMLTRLSVPLTVRAYRLLRSVQVAGAAGLGMGHVADVLQCDPARATRLVDKMQGQGLVRRQLDPVDRRRRSVHATDRGAEVLEEAEGLRTIYLQEVLADWASSDVEALGRFLRRFNGGVRRHTTLPRAPRHEEVTDSRSS